MRLALLCLALSVPAAAADWPSFRGVRASGVADGSELPASWDVPAGKNLRWKTEIPGLSHSSPIVWGDRVFVATAVRTVPGEPVFKPGLYGDVDVADDLVAHAFKLYALDRATGKILWERTAHEGVPRIARHIKSSHADSTPATDGKRVVMLFGSGLHGYDLDGKPLWQRDLGVLNVGWFFDPSYQWGYGASPVLHADLVLVQADLQKDSFVGAYRLSDGTPVWKTPRSDVPSWATPTVVESEGRTQIVTNGGRFIRSYDVRSGKQLWQLSTDSEVPVATPIAAGGLIYVTDGYPPKRPIYAVRPGASGDISLPENTRSSEAIAWSWPMEGTYIPTPIAYRDHFYTLANQGILTCYDAKTGEKRYRERVGGAYSASPIAADGKLYLPSEEGDVIVVKAGPTYELVGKYPVGEVLMATPAIAPGMLVVRGRRHVFGIGVPPAAPAEPK